MEINLVLKSKVDKYLTYPIKLLSVQLVISEMRDDNLLRVCQTMNTKWRGEDLFFLLVFFRWSFFLVLIRPFRRNLFSIPIANRI